LVRVITILGESGAGKSYLSKVIAAHAQWVELTGRGQDFGFEARLKPYLSKYVEIPLPALPDTLIESELFGYKKGAFTGAVKNTPGLLGGDGEGDSYEDILLDEIGDASPLLQAKILTVVEHGKFMPVGGRAGDECETNARLLLATNKDIEALVEEGKFREDLYWRIRDYIVRVPPLRNQPENIKELVREIERELLQKKGVDLEAREELHLGETDIEWAQGHQWKGNIRELRHAVARWHFEEGKASLEDIVKQIHEEVRNTGGNAGVGHSVDKMVRERLVGVGKGDWTPPGTLGQLVKEFDRQVEAAVVRWYEETQPDSETLLAIFSRQKSIDSIRNKISQWKRQQGERK
jgi:transcriptional regulator with GAF, ATPase, and Fis domain